MYPLTSETYSCDILRISYPVAMETCLQYTTVGRTPPEAQAYIRVLEARVATLEGMMQTLQEQLNQTSRNSSRPPSSDSPHRERPHRPRSTRRRGGQPGHPGSTRTLIPVEEVDEVVLKPAHHALPSPYGRRSQAMRHQVIEIPPFNRS